MIATGKVHVVKQPKVKIKTGTDVLLDVVYVIKSNEFRPNFNLNLSRLNYILYYFSIYQAKKNRGTIQLSYDKSIYGPICREVRDNFEEVSILLKTKLNNKQISNKLDRETRKILKDITKYVLYYEDSIIKEEILNSNVYIESDGTITTKDLKNETVTMLTPNKRTGITLIKSIENGLYKSDLMPKYIRGYADAWSRQIRL